MTLSGTDDGTNVYSAQYPSEEQGQRQFLL